MSSSSLHAAQSTLPAEDLPPTEHGQSLALHGSASVSRASAVKSTPPAPTLIQCNRSQDDGCPIPKPSSSLNATQPTLTTEYPLSWVFSVPSPVPREPQVKQMSPAQCYRGNDGPWFPKLPFSSHETNQTQIAENTASRGFGRPEKLKVSSSDSGYGTRRSVSPQNPTERDQGIYSAKTPFQPFQENISGPSASPNVPNSGTLLCPTCSKSFRRPTEFNRHSLQHKKPFVCTVPGCPRTQGFAKTNDLQRHMLSKHSELNSNITALKMYRCQVPGCKFKKDKSWPRLDNFRNHLKRVHRYELRTENELDDMVRRGEFLWPSPQESDSTPKSQANEFSEGTMNSGVATTFEGTISPPERPRKSTANDLPGWTLQRVEQKEAL
ncbi:hypothetical protein V8E51_007738 [Hyaloscypha variabilis]